MHARLRSLSSRRERTTLASACLALAAAAALWAAPAQADPYFVANLTHDQETTQGTLLTSGGLPRPLSFGFASFALNEAKTALTMTVHVYNIDITGSQTLGDTNDNLVNAHIHAGPPNGQPGTNAGVRWGFFGAPDNDVAPNDLVVTPFLNAVGGVFVSKWDFNEGNSTTLAAQLPSIRAGLSYVNFHTVQFGPGEIRGQILATPAPEPGTLGLIGLGGLSAVSIALRKRRKA